MTGLDITMPFASWRVEYARQYRETHPVPPPATVYGFLLALVGEEEADRYHGAQITAGRVAPMPKSVILRKIRRHKKPKFSDPSNFILDFQEVLTEVRILAWIEGPILEVAVTRALTHPEEVDRFGALSLGESTFLVNQVRRIADPATAQAETFLLDPQGRLSLPVIPDHESNTRTRYATGNLVPLTGPPPIERMPTIA